MSDKLSVLKDIYSGIVNYYESHIFTPLESYEKRLKDSFKEVLDEYSFNYSLTHKGSIEEKKYYILKSRVKSSTSLREKFVRKNLGLKIIKELNIEKVEDLTTNDNKALITSRIKEIDDIIGIRIVSELLQDNKNIYSLLIDKSSELRTKGVELFDSIQPEPMKNGLPIYKIKGIFEREVHFELQIKSKIEEAWGEMDHSLFYKDYSFQPIKSTVALTMNNVGHLLEKIEKLLFDLRDSSRSYQENAAHLNFLHILSNEFTKKVVDKIKIPCDLSNISTILRTICHEHNVQVLKISNLALDEINFNPQDSLCQSFRECRNLSHDLLFTELFFLSLKKELEEEITQENYDNLIYELIELLLNDSKKRLIKNYEYPEDLIDSGFDHLKKLLNYLNPNLLIQNEEHSLIIELLSKLNSSKDDIDFELDEDIFESQILPIFIIGLFNGNIDRFIKTNELDLENLAMFLEFFTKSQESSSYKVLIKELKQVIS